jgi:glucan phosphoethanolaminetransferase (alkaline phosphatase superfamily)
MKLSILDQVHITAGGNAEQSLQNAKELARLGDSLGYERIWFAEHHGSQFDGERRARNHRRLHRGRNGSDPCRNRRRHDDALLPFENRGSLQNTVRLCTRSDRFGRRPCPPEAIVSPCTH